MYLITLARGILNLPYRFLEWIKGRKLIDYDGIVEQLAKDYILRNEGKIKSERGKIVQDYISRHLPNTTVCVGDQMGVYFRHLDGLVDCLITELTHKLSDVPLSTFKSGLLSVVDREYDKLIHIVPGLLYQSQLLDSNTIRDFENGVLRKKQKAKDRIENQCAISEHNRVIAEKHRERWYQSRNIQAALITVFVGAALTLIISWIVRHF